MMMFPIPRNIYSTPLRLLIPSARRSLNPITPHPWPPYSRLSNSDLARINLDTNIVLSSTDQGIGI